MVQFINPYNFIPLGTKRAEQGKDEGTLTGVIEYSVLTKTPLFIPNTSCDERFVEGVKDHKSYDFFSYQDLSDAEEGTKCERPVIPGSEIRGMFRSIYEMMTDSCMSVLDEDMVLSKRTLEVFKAGLIKREGNGAYSLYAAEDCIWRTKGAYNQQSETNWKKEYYTRKCYIQDNIPEGTRVAFDFQTGRRRGKPVALNVKVWDSERSSGRKEGYIIKGEPGPEQKPNRGGISPQKHCCHIFRLKNGGQPIQKSIGRELENLDQLLKIYEKNSKEEEDNKTGAYWHEGYREYAEKLNDFRAGRGESYFPVYYSREEGFLWLSPASITREICNKRIMELAGGYESCAKKENLCPACSLFGALGEDFAVSSKLRFSDLECEQQDSYEDYFEAVTTLYPLASPKPENMEFYVKRPEGAVFWTYDYYIDADGILHENNDARFNGRKFYWHQIGKKLPSNVDPSGQNITIRPLRAKKKFSGKLYFHKITGIELERLIWLLNGGEEKSELSEKKYGYRLGAAKPLGLGSIATCVDKVCLRKVKMKEGKINISYEDGYMLKQHGGLFSEERIKQFQICMAFNKVNAKDVQYPCTEKNKGNDGFTASEGYLWFVENHRIKDNKKITQTRKEMYYREYMEPLKPQLWKVDGLQRNQGNSGYNQGVRYNGQDSSKNIKRKNDRRK